MLSTHAQIERLVARITRYLEIPLHLMSAPIKDRIRTTAAMRLSALPDTPVTQKEIKAMVKELQEFLAANTPTSSTPYVPTPARGQITHVVSSNTTGGGGGGSMSSANMGEDCGASLERSQLSTHRASKSMLATSNVVVSPTIKSTILHSPPSSRRPSKASISTSTSTTIPQPLREVLGEEMLARVRPETIPKGFINSNSANVEKKLMKMLKEQEWADRLKADAQNEKDSARLARMKRIEQAKEAKLVLENQREAKKKATISEKKEDLVASKELLVELDRRDAQQAEQDRARVEKEQAMRLHFDSINVKAQRERDHEKKMEKEREAAFIQTIVQREESEKAALTQKRLEKRAALREYLAENSDALERKKDEKRIQVEADKTYVESQREILGLREAQSYQQVKLETPRGEALKQRTLALSNVLLSEKKAKEDRLKAEEERQIRRLAEKHLQEDAQRREELLKKKRDQEQFAAALTAQLQQQRHSNSGVISSGRRAGNPTTPTSSSYPSNSSVDADDAILSRMSSNRDRTVRTKQLAAETAEVQRRQMLEKRRREADVDLPPPIGH